MASIALLLDTELKCWCFLHYIPKVTPSLCFAVPATLGVIAGWL